MRDKSIIVSKFGIQCKYIYSIHNIQYMCLLNTFQKHLVNQQIEYSNMFLHQTAHPRMQTYRLCQRVGLSSHCNGAPGRHLDFDHPQVEAVRTFVEHCHDTHGINKRLILNFDQVWTTMYSHSKRVLHKPVESLGNHPSQHKPSMNKMIHSIREALAIESGEESPPEPDQPGYTPRPVVLNAQANVSPIEGWRFPRTTTTISWSDGELAAAWITIKEGSAPDHVVKQLNSELAGLLHIHVQDSKYHMWNSSTMLHFLDFLTVQLRMKRMKENLTPKDGRALILCDKASVHACQAFEPLRRRWENENCALICHGSSLDTVKIPPGWGAAGAPNDGWHQWYHLLRQSYQKVACNQGRHMKLRQALGDLDLAVDGSVRFSLLGM